MVVPNSFPISRNRINIRRILTFPLLSPFLSFSNSAIQKRTSRKLWDYCIGY